jgi:ribokinase
MKDGSVTPLKPKITVLGSFVVDLMARAPHLPGAGETVKGSTFKLGPGGKGSNQGVAAHRTGSQVTMITKIGSDAFADVARKSFEDEGMDCAYIYQDKDRSTGAALIMVDEITSQNIILVTLGACNHITDSEVEQARGVIETANIFLTQLETNLDAVEKAVDIAYRAGVRVVLNPAPVQRVPQDLLRKVDVFVPNEVEAAILSGARIKSLEDVRRAADNFLGQGVSNVIITLGEKGAYVANPQRQAHLLPVYVDVVDTTGAGDAFCGALATALAEGKDLFVAAEFAMAAAALSVTKIGTAPAMPDREAVETLLSEFKAREVN